MYTNSAFTRHYTFTAAKNASRCVEAAYAKTPAVLTDRTMSTKQQNGERHDYVSVAQRGRIRSSKNVGIVATISCYCCSPRRAFAPLSCGRTAAWAPRTSTSTGPLCTAAPASRTPRLTASCTARRAARSCPSSAWTDAAPRRPACRTACGSAGNAAGRRTRSRPAYSPYQSPCPVAA